MALAKNLVEALSLSLWSGVAAQLPLLAQSLKLALVCTRGHLSALPFSQDHCTIDQRCLFPMVSKSKIILI